LPSGLKHTHTAPNMDTLTYEQSLIAAGLTKDEAAVYEILIKNGPLRASSIQRRTTISRPLIYKVLDELTHIGLVEKKEEPGKVAIFVPAHPIKLRDVIEKQREEAERAKLAIDGVLGSLTSDFNLVSGKPGVQYYEGLSGIHALYATILKEKKDIKLIRSIDDERVPDLESLVKQQIMNQVSLGIHAQTITPFVKDIPADFQKLDEQNFVTRRIVPLEKLSTPAQIIIFGNYVGITSYSDPLITTIVENNAIAKTMQHVFDYMWEASTPDHERIIKTLGRTPTPRETRDAF
jgi:sugar-specific transcriptional regulator TrmB